MLITKEMKMAEVIHENYLLLPIINRFGIRLGFGDKTVDQICNSFGVHSDFFIEIINLYHQKDYSPQGRIADFSAHLIVEYLKKAHHYYLTVKLPEIEALIEQLIQQAHRAKGNWFLVKDFFSEYRSELVSHINEEETGIFPYIMLIEDFKRDKKREQLVGLNKYRSDDFAEEHDDVESKLFDLKNIIIKYLPPSPNSNLCNLILFELFELEKDLNDHAALEDKVLVPKVTKMEEELKAVLTVDEKLIAFEN